MKKYAVFGLGVSGKAVVAAFPDSYSWDDNEKNRLPVSTPPEEWNWDEIKALVLAPGIPLTHPEPHPIVRTAKEHNVPVICDIEVLYRENPSANYIGITGTNGKSTTTALIGHILEKYSPPPHPSPLKGEGDSPSLEGRGLGEGCKTSIKVQIGGNIGIPALALEKLERHGYYVLELSSFQLDLIDRLHLKIGVLLNITPDHLERHGGMEGYINSKKKIFKNCGHKIIGIDDEYSAGMAEDKTTISINKPADFYFKQNTLIANGKEIPINSGLIGEHNKQNIVAAFAVCSKIGIKEEDIVKGIESFGGLKHRIQTVRKIGNITFVNDSKATNAESASKALACFDNIYWIAGGVAKAGGINSLTDYFPKIKKAYLIGQAKEEFAETLKNKVDFTICTNLEDAVYKAFNDAKKQDEKAVILLSPACASFDMWKNFEKRGEEFEKIAQEIEK